MDDYIEDEIMITSLRWLRGFIGFLVIAKFSSTVNFLTEVLKNSSYEYLIATVADCIILSIFFGIYYALYKGINKLHAKRTDNGNIPLLKNVWNL